MDVIEYELKKYGTYKFKFSVDSGNNKFGESGYFNSTDMSNDFLASETYFEAMDKNGPISFVDDSFVFVRALSIEGVKGILMTAKCDKF